MNLLASLAALPREIASTLHMKPVQALIWLTCWACWTLGSLQYYALPFVLSDVADYLKVAQTNVSEANTTTMLSRAVGAVIFGILSDQYGRKIPMLVDLVLMCGFTVATGFSQNFGQLIGFRLLFGVSYGGTYGLAMATVLEAVPARARGVVAGFTQQGFSAGYLFASGLHLGMNPYGWRSLFWVCAGLTVPVLIVHALTPHYTVATARHDEEHGGDSAPDARAAVGGNLPFLKKVTYVLRYHYKAFIYACCLTSCLATMGHGTMDLYPTFLVTQRKLNIHQETYVTCILQIGGILGGVVGGFLAHKFSAKWVALVSGLLIAPWLPLWVLPTSWNLLALGAFFLQFFYGAAIGNLGNMLQQLCPHPGIRAAFTGVAYNIGNAVSSIAPTIETSLGERFPTADGTPNYARTQMILVGIVIFCLTLTLILMPLNQLNKDWDREDPNARIPGVEANEVDKPEGKGEEGERGGSSHVEDVKA
ncbi:MFS general substrate transporter [Aspergillus heteromorphus CBS 117.55]|uniref:MFS general substrate transporter n=1 Tax=Aspergillus heteromorphus CBS 117.55 TaxID=1448321 RepID=A0A317WY08_9EURO|nr:MFS general substrate transporter [Aspergillus heteromorphus CBS 117.55]PWY90222.1 MFS general substrate transporter [Aspergillus heteromorphus CBS 117.55]